MKNFFKFIVPILFIIIGLYILDFSFYLLNQPNDIMNILGFLTIIGVLYISIITKVGTFLFK